MGAQTWEQPTMNAFLIDCIALFCGGSQLIRALMFFMYECEARHMARGEQQ